MKNCSAPGAVGCDDPPQTPGAVSRLAPGSGGTWGYSWNNNRAKAQADAVNLCNGSKNMACVVQEMTDLPAEDDACLQPLQDTVLRPF